jgi:hypothetical protein
MKNRMLKVVATLAVFPAAAGAQTASERLLWSFKTDDRTTEQFIARAPSGVIYTADNTATYALSPEGDLLWSTPDASGDAFGARPIGLGADGTLYTGVSPAGEPYAPVIALNPDGSTRWRFIPDQPLDLAGGPGVGPDGAIYAVQEGGAAGGLGAFALDAEGNLIWSNPGDPPVPEGVSLLSNSEIAFGADRFHVGIVNSRSGGNPAYYTFGLDGEQLWETWDLRPHTTTFPTMDPENRLVFPWGQTGMRAFSPGGVEEWFTLHPGRPQLVVRAAVGASGRIYTGDAVGVELWAINPDGATHWVQPASDELLGGVGVSPDEQVIIAWGGNFGESDWIRGYSAVAGDLLWEVQLEPENGLNQYVSSYEPVFTPDSQVVYLTTQFVSSENRYGYLLALRAQDGGGCYADCDRSGGLDFFDFLCFQNQFIAGAPEADCDESGGLDFFDFLCFQNAFAAGCP